MNHKIKHIIIRSGLIIKCINFVFNFINKKKYESEICSRSKINIYDYRHLCRILPYAPSQIVIDNNLYGIGDTICAYAGIMKPINAYIEHGVFFGNLIREDMRIWNVPTIITFSETRRQHLLAGGINKKIVVVGPYIHYSDTLLSKQELLDEKRKLGKVLLVFPSHSIKNTEAVYNTEELINSIEEERGNFDTVIISLYWIDANNAELVRKYLHMGYKVVTSGHRFDRFFLARQKSIIELADCTMSNSVGTHIGYCIYMNKPHRIIAQKVDEIPRSEKLRKHLEQSRTKEEFERMNLEKKDVMNAFLRSGWEINELHRAIVDKYWGTSQIKTKQELNEYFN